MATDETTKVNPQLDAAVTATAPEDSLEAAFIKLGGIKVLGATPMATGEPDPEAFAVHGGKMVGKVPTAAPPTKG